MQFFSLLLTLATVSFSGPIPLIPELGERTWETGPLTNLTNLLQTSSSSSSSSSTTIVAGVGDAKRWTDAYFINEITQQGTYKVQIECYDVFLEILNREECKVKPEKGYAILHIKRTDGLLGDAVTRQYRIIANNGVKDKACADKGSIERGYANTCQQVFETEVVYEEEVCCTIPKRKGSQDTQMNALVHEKLDPSRVYLQIKNAGYGHGGDDHGFPRDGKIRMVDFDFGSGYLLVSSSQRCVGYAPLLGTYTTWAECAFMEHYKASGKSALLESEGFTGGEEETDAGCNTFGWNHNSEECVCCDGGRENDASGEWAVYSNEDELTGEIRWDGPLEGCMHGGPDEQYDSLEEAQTACEKDENCGGVTDNCQNEGAQACTRSKRYEPTDCTGGEKAYKMIRPGEPLYHLLAINTDCKYHENLGDADNAFECAEKCEQKVGCSVFIYGHRNSDAEHSCWGATTAVNGKCDETGTNTGYDLYRLAIELDTELVAHCEPGHIENCVDLDSGETCQCSDGQICENRYVDCVDCPPGDHICENLYPNGDATNYWFASCPPEKICDTTGCIDGAVDFDNQRMCCGGYCPRPSNGCMEDTDVYENVECDGDGILDHVCTTTTDSRRWVVLSTSGCSGWVSDDSGSCVSPEEEETKNTTSYNKKKSRKEKRAAKKAARKEKRAAKKAARKEKRAAKKAARNEKIAAKKAAKKTKKN